METIFFANHKGGCGKTTGAMHLGYLLRDRNMRVLMVDADRQGNLYRRMADLREKPVDYPIYTWAHNCDCIWMPDELVPPPPKKFDVMVVDCAPMSELPAGARPTHIVIPIDGLDAALGAGDIADVEFDGHYPIILIVLNGTNEGGKQLQKIVTDFEETEKIYICPTEITRGGAIKRTDKTCKPAWYDTYKGSRDVKTIKEAYSWVVDMVIGKK